MRLKLVLSLYCFCLCFVAVAQSQKKAERVQKKADRYFAEALQLKANKKTDEACKKMVVAISYDPTSPDGYSQLGQWYFDAHKFTDAVQTFRNASSHCKNGPKRFAKSLAKSCIYAGMPDEALGLIGKYRTDKDSAEWNGMSRQASFIKQAIAQQSTSWPVNLGVRVNTEYPELFPSMAVDTQTLYFTRRVENIDEDLFYAKADSCGGWFGARNMGQPPNSSSQESSQSISADGHYLFFTRCDNRSENGYAEGGCDLYMAYRATNDTEWTIAQPFGATINTLSYEGMPTLSPDSRELYFVSDRPGGYGGYDIWTSVFEDGLWQKPVNAGPAINTSGNETTPYLCPDNRTLYFASDKWPGMGGTDLFVSRKKGDKWSRAENLGYHINSACDERSICTNIDNKKCYFASDRQGPAGNYDIYEGTLPGTMLPDPISYIDGYVYDSISKVRLNSAAMYITDLARGDTLYQLRSNRGDASYLITLAVGHTYVIATGYMGYTDAFDTVVFRADTAVPHVTHNIRMLASNYDPIQHINDSLAGAIHFDVNHTELTDSDKAAINTIMGPWLEEKGIVVYVNAYTDNTGTPMINEGLSYKRAQTVAHEIISLGIDGSMVVAKGWGEANAIAPNDTEEGQRKNRRVEIILKR
jgi:outer membrane protein OmpA-like peptidoglycan-associated protein